MFPDLFRDDVFRIETRRLWLRWPTACDADSLQSLAGDEAVAETTARIPHPLDRAAVDAFVVASRAANLAGTGLTLALCERSRPGRAIGMIEIARGADSAVAQLGYWLGRPYWGAGLMTEAADALVHAWFAWTPATRLDASARVANPASRRVLEKAGFVRTGRGPAGVPARGGAGEADRFRLERGRWLARADAGQCALAAAE
ncbi:GNAT family N-acetyltransferase [Methylobacterium sp. J-076]|uniref:GNAT family N-acetyltransferase n=1 Tax=Methylobacterium sp. J-076 TaxID=2836655 RepID=UPI001FB867DD|nr:GNAT family N-acetyltransferase [Methylobacterium sp. J-076]MCJ2015062.1 GNAT family N-acetyltransferase [Methylobacterium sp. J-076]